MGMRHWIAMLALLWVAGSSVTSAAPTTGAQDGRLSWSVLEDPSGLLDADAVRARDAEFSSGPGRLNPRYSRSAWWGRLTLPPGDTTQTRWLVMRVARLEQVHLWIARPDGWQDMAAGTSIPHASWPLDTPTATFPIELPAHEATTVYLRVAGRNALSFDADLRTPADGQRAQQQLLALDAVLAGTLLFEIAGCVLLAAMQRHFAPLMVAAYALFYGLYEVAYQGHGFQYLWPDATDGASRVMNVLAASSAAALSLSLWALSPTTGVVGMLRRVLLVLSLALLPVAAYAWFGDFRTAVPFVLGLSLLTMSVGAVLGVTVWRQGMPQGLYVAIVGVVMLLGTLPRHAYLAGLVPHSAWTVYALPVLSVANGLVLIAAVLARLRTTDSARLASHAALLQSRATQAERSRLLAYLGHDLRAPLSATISHLRRLESDAGGATRQLRAQAERAVLHQLELIDELVAYARDETQAPDLVPTAHFLHALLQDVADQGAALAREHDNHFEATFAPDLPPVVRVDAKHLRRLLLNLLSNAAKFTRNGRLRLDIEATATGDAPRLRCSVGDTGPGIAEADLVHVFDPFWRAADNPKGTPGNGLGLAIAKRLAEAMGGSLSVASRPGVGTRFTAELPLDLGVPEDVQWPALAAGATASFGSGRTALVVDPNPASREHVAELLFAAGFDVLQARDAATAVVLLKDRHVHLLVTEQDLPDASGWNLLDRVDAVPGFGAPITLLHGARPPRRPPNLPDGLQFSAHALKPIGGDACLALLAGWFDVSPRPSTAASR